MQAAAIAEPLPQTFLTLHPYCIFVRPQRPSRRSRPRPQADITSLAEELLPVYPTVVEPLGDLFHRIENYERGVGRVGEIASSGFFARPVTYVTIMSARSVASVK